MLKALCPECDHVVEFHSPPRLKERVTCTQCYSRLVVIQLSPLALDWAFMEPFEGSVQASNRKQSSSS
jgi:hypothetical protein